MLLSWLIFVLVLIASGMLLSAILVVLMALTLLRPNRMTDAKATMVLQRLSPGDLHLKFKDVRFDVRDERTGRPLTIAGWWIPAAQTSPRTVLLIHGYADAKVGAIAWAPTLHGLGWNVLTIDLRAHGVSPVRFSTAGYWERYDVNQVINQFRAQRPRETGTFVLFGISLGAAVAVAVAALRESEQRESAASGSDIDAIVMESPFADYRRAVAAHGAMRGMPAGMMRDAAVRLAEWLADADFRAVRPMDLLARISCPVMVIRAGDDPFIPDQDAADMARALRARGDARDAYWTINDAGHVLGLAAAGPEEYRQRIGAFLETIVLPSVSLEAGPPPAAVYGAGGHFDR